MATVQRANVILTVEDADVDKYLAKGYKQIDEFGNIVKESYLNDVASIKEAYLKAQDEIKQLKETNSKLKAQIAKLKKKAKEDE